ncbi:uncharacterized protein LOC121054722 [Oryza brachyantha]|uniref:uncharacterized protein LOC121054722 n=1 Tax=Oryza brachyantha TaxID=4533 RepID=UPI001ADC00B0|nr:uncharacterized protein LOC121054722 [Oryza brachyantha]
MAQDDRLDTLVKLIEEAEKNWKASDERTRADLRDLKHSMDSRLPTVETQVEDQGNNESFLHSGNFSGTGLVFSGNFSVGGSVPPMTCPQFNGDNPQMWKANCEQYFDVYGIHPFNWVKVATLNFTGNAAFTKDRYEALIRQWIHLEQIGSVAEYIEKFDSIVHQLIAYDNNEEALEGVKPATTRRHEGVAYVRNPHRTHTTSHSTPVSSRPSCEGRRDSDHLKNCCKPLSGTECEYKGDDANQGEEEDILMAISNQALSGTETSKSIRLRGWVQNSEVLMLVADGGQITCTHMLPQCHWLVQGQSFKSNFRMIPLGSYDIILGMDWLEQFSPMQVNTIEMAKKAPIPEQIQPLVQEFKELFQEPTDLPPRRNCDHHIPLVEGAKPVNLRPYRYKPTLKDEIERQVAEMLQSGVIQHSHSAFSSLALLVKKKDGTWRLCIDYRQLNDITVKRRYHVPVIDELLDELAGSKWFSKLDLRAGYHQIRMVAGDEHKTDFQTHSGHYEYRVMSFGLTGAPATFLSAMNETLSPALRKFALVFFDDILIYSPDFQTHLAHIRAIFELLAKDQWKIKLSKCAFGQQQISYLGHVISADGVSTDPKKIQDVVSWPIPSNIKKLRGFLGLAGYYRKFVKDFGSISKPLTLLLRKGVFVVETNASDHGVGAVLSQDKHPLAYINKALGPKTEGLSTYEKECMAILMAVDHWRSYLQHAQFIILIDHHSLMHLSDQRLHTPWQHKAFTKLLRLQYRICYRKGATNSAADALSRRDHSTSASEGHILAISETTPLWLQEVTQGYQDNTLDSQLLAELILNPQGGHSGFPTTYRRIKSLFAWPQMKVSIQQQLKTCQMDGQTERVNQCLEIFLRCFVHATPSKSPFEALYGYSPGHFGISSANCSVPDLGEWLQERKMMQHLLQQHLHRAQQQMKHQADKKRSFREFHEGDWVYLKLHPYVQMSVACRANHKLSFRYYGPYQVVARVGLVAYKLDLPASSSIHPVVHVSQLRAAHGFHPTVQLQLPTLSSHLQVPAQVLDHRLTKKGNSVTPQVLV